MKTVIAGEWGDKLPIGIVKGDELVRDFDFKLWTMVQEKAIGKKRQDEMTQSQFVSVVMAEMATTLASESLVNKPDPHKLLAFNRMYMNDVMYMYIRLRVKALGSKLPMDVMCGNCRGTFQFDADLDTLEVVVKESVEELTRPVELEDGIMFQGKLRKSLIIRPSLWEAMENLTLNQAQNPGDMAGHLFASAIMTIKGVNQNPLAFADDSFDSMSKRDINFLMQQIDENNAGPKMIVEGQCIRCRSKFRNVLRWEFDNFF